jgi:Lipocalin-like domain
MSKILTFICFLLMGLLLSSCTGETKNNKLILAYWQGSSWVSNGKILDRNVTSTNFTFNEKEIYRFENNGNIETGTYKVENDNLFTKPEGQEEIMVKISKLTTDSLVFDMNRGGQAETLTLIKQKK